MPIQTMGLDYSWLVNLADVISRARQQPTGARAQAAPRPAQGVAAPEKSRYEREREERREDLLTLQERKHETAMKRMDVDSALAQAMSQERIATMGAEAGTEQAQIGAAGQVAAAQKTTMEKGYEILDMLWKMDKPSRDEFITTLEAKRAENTKARGERPVSTISTGGRTITLPGTTEEPIGDPNDPLTALEAIGAYNPETGVSDPKPTGAAAKPEVDQYMELLDDMLTKNPQSMIAITTGKGWDELKETMRTIGEEAGFGEETITTGIGMFEAIIPEYVEPEEGGLAGAIKGALTPFGVGREELPLEAIPGSEAYLGGAGAFEEAPKVEKAPGFAKNLEEFIETIITGPFHPAYEKWKDKRTGEPVVKEPTPKEAGEITEQDVITEMGTWDEETIKEFQRRATEAGLYKGPVDGKISHALESVMKEYYKTHKGEWK